MTPEQIELLDIHPVKFQVGDSRIFVESRGDGQWAVCRDGFCLADDGIWQWEPLPSSRDDAFLAKCRFPFDRALEMAATFSKRQ